MKDINVDDVLKILHKYGKNIFVTDEKKYSDMVDEISNLKALKQEPKTGHWISHREHCEQLGVMPSGLGDYEWCSNCDCGIDVVEWHRNHYNFCPSCGIKMVKHYMPIQSLYVDINDIIDES